MIPLSPSIRGYSVLALSLIVAALTVVPASRPPADPSTGADVILFHNDSICRYFSGKIMLARPLVHPVLLLGFDVYGQPVEKTVARLTQLGHDPSKVRGGTWQCRKMWIVGAAAGGVQFRPVSLRNASEAASR